MTQRQPSNRKHLHKSSAKKNTDYYLNRLNPEVLQSFNEIQLQEINRLLEETISQPVSKVKIIDLRFTLNLLISKFYIVLLVGKDQRRSPRKSPISNGITRMGNIAAVIILLLAINLLISAVIIIAAYLLKTIIGIDLTSGGHFSDYIKDSVK